ncbi:thioesterase family protein [Microbulbifer thermotolerans]|uniref:thioesterase family protein n=1 Tax=Microbulbifer thermotolerans TaxID=252514 RepID=UPI002248CCA1|nr:thioesterase family protein [Microbulbifer thermotolerans]MCX2782292.1 thioesterase family protein [Microbulbifer thermotolerans]MCX2832775.1 thioesterase family protein [Microbulbifer thermotolerans]MCX2833553.1 thioesterase family protein [Microbulbifer thermotolerans]
MSEPSPGEFRDLVKGFFEQIPFNRQIGLEMRELDLEALRLSASFELRPELIGNVWKNILHGGVIATALDTVGGLTAMVAAYQRLGDISWREKTERLSKLGTVDMRVDYLKPGRGQHFICQGSILRTGNKLVVARMELVNDASELIATGTATYLY